MAVIYGTNLRNTLNGTSGRDQIYGWDHLNALGDGGPAGDHDILYGGIGDDRLYGGAGNDVLSDWFGVNTLTGGDGDDTLSGNPGTGGLLYGGAGIDLFDMGFLPGRAMVLVWGGPEVEQVLPGGMRISGVEGIALYGTPGGDSITGGAYDDVMRGKGGDDRLVGAGGNDRLEADTGRDTVLGGAGNDTLSRVETDGADVIDGGAGIDLFEVERVSEVGSYGLALLDAFVLADGTTVAGMERLDFTGTIADEHVTGGALQDRIRGNGGDDLLEGLGGDDLLSVHAGVFGAATLDGGAGDDTVESVNRAGAGSAFWGGAGVDMLQMSFTGARQALVLAVADLAGRFHAPDGVTLGGFEQVQLVGTLYADRLTGGKYDDTLTGQDGADLLQGGTGDDLIEGDRGNDTLDGGAGSDDLVGGLGADQLTGRAGADSFVFSEAPVAGQPDGIGDFATGVDDIRLVRRAFTGMGLGDLAAADFVLGTRALDRSDHILYDRATGRVWHDADGSGTAAPVVFLLLVAGTALAASDFVVL